MIPALFLSLVPMGFVVEAQEIPHRTGEAVAPQRVDYGWRIRPLEGDPVPLDAFRGKILFINAWASWCIPCVREMSSIERLSDRVSDTDIRFLLVAVEGERPVQQHLRRYPVDLPIFLEAERFPPLFGLRGIPMSWIVDREGRIVYRHFGAADWDAPAVEAFLRDLAVPPDQR